MLKSKKRRTEKKKGTEIDYTFACSPFIEPPPWPTAPSTVWALALSKRPDFQALTTYYCS